MFALKRHEQKCQLYGRASAFEVSIFFIHKEDAFVWRSSEQEIPPFLKGCITSAHIHTEVGLLNWL